MKEKKCIHCGEIREDHKAKSLHCPNRFFKIGFRDSKRWSERKTYEEKKVERAKNPFS